jgi:hypothetical protein
MCNGTHAWVIVLDGWSAAQQSIISSRKWPMPGTSSGELNATLLTFKTAS